MCAGQRKPRVAMLGDGEGRAVEIHNCVAVFASVLVRRGGKLPVMRVFVTIRTGREFHFVNGVFASREMALPTFNRNVFSPQGIARCIVLLDAEERRLPAFHRVAFRAFALLRPRCKLALVWIRLMAIRAICKG